MSTNQQPNRKNNTQKKQTEAQQHSDGQHYNQKSADADLQDDNDGMDSDRRTGTSLAGNTANESFNATAEKQQTDRDKNAEG